MSPNRIGCASEPKTSNMALNVSQCGHPSHNLGGRFGNPSSTSQVLSAGIANAARTRSGVVSPSNGSAPVRLPWTAFPGTPSKPVSRSSM